MVMKTLTNRVVDTDDDFLDMDYNDKYEYEDYEFENFYRIVKRSDPYIDYKRKIYETAWEEIIHEYLPTEIEYSGYRNLVYGPVSNVMEGYLQKINNAGQAYDYGKLDEEKQKILRYIRSLISPTIS